MFEYRCILHILRPIALGESGKYCCSQVGGGKTIIENIMAGVNNRRQKCARENFKKKFWTAWQKYLENNILVPVWGAKFGCFVGQLHCLYGRMH
jgi:hypothetical protein